VPEGVSEALGRSAKQLHGALPKKADLTVKAFKLEWAQLFNIFWHVTLVGTGLEQILCHLRFLTLLQVAKNKIYPLWQTHGNGVGLEGHSELKHEVGRRRCPVGKTYIADWVAHVICAEICALLIE